MSKPLAAQRRQDIVTRPIGKQLVSLTIPMLFALIAIMGLGLVDSFFISYLGTIELAAIGFITPITMIVTSVALGLGMAISSLNSKLIGAGKMDQAARLITDGFYLTTIAAMLSIAILTFQLQNIFYAIGADETTMPAILDYVLVWIYAVPLIMFSQVSSSTFRSLGDTKTAAKIAISMTLFNMIFDPLLIFGLGPFPRLGMQGAALATVIAVCVSSAIAFYQLGIRERMLLWVIPQWENLKTNIKHLLEIAIPAVLANVIGPVTAALLTLLVAQFGNDAVAGFGVGTRIEAIILIFAYALSSTLPMFIGQNLGAERKDRAGEAIRIAFKFIMVFQLVIYILLAWLAEPIAALFSDDQTVHKTISYYIVLVPISYGLSGVVILVNVSMNVLGKPRIALYINIARMLLFQLPFAYIGGHLYGITGLFIGITAGNICTYIVAKKMLKKVLADLNIPLSST